MFVGVRRSDQNRVVVLDYLPVRLPWFPGSTGRDFLLQERHFLFWERGSLKRRSLEALQDQDRCCLLGLWVSLKHLETALVVADAV